MYFPSKKDIWLGLLFWGTVIICFFPLFFDQDIIAILVLVPLSFFLIWLWFTTGYVIDGDVLIVKFGPFKKKIHIGEISRIRRTKNPLSAPALSLNRLEITYTRYGLTLISPKDQEKFVSILLEINPNIEVDRR